MLDRREFLGGLAAGAAFAGSGAAAAQVPIPGPSGYGAPAGTSPFPPEVFRERRRRLMQAMGGGVGVVYSAASFGGGAVEGLARQDSDFAYLTGIQDEVGAALVLAPDERTHKEHLLLAARDPERERWEGSRLPLGQGLRERTGFERIQRVDRLGGLVAGIASRSGTLHFLGPIGSPNGPVPAALDLYGRVSARVPGTRIVNSHNLIRTMRMVKEPRELELIRRAIAATERGILAGMRAARPGMYEAELKQIIEAEFRAAGANALAFSSIVAAGQASAVLHYTGGNNRIAAGDVILLDLGAEVGRYAADISRTFPVDGRFTPEQRAVYDTVLRAQEAAMALTRAGAFYEDLDAASEGVLRAAGNGDDVWHGLGHFVGLDVHDAGDYSQPLPAGAVLTLEPGAYLPHRGFGVRIEDDFLIKAGGNEHMSNGTPRRPADIEALLASR
jgi:Xaa-Pro aminopeptidase